MLFLTVLIEKPKYPLVPVFMSVDSERDTPDILAKYVKGNKFSSYISCILMYYLAIIKGLLILQNSCHFAGYLFSL